jgi:hypothetical protein
MAVQTEGPWSGSKGRIGRKSTGPPNDPTKIATEQLEALPHQWILQATGNDPELAEQTRRELVAKVRVIEGEAEAGIEPGAIVIDGVATPVETRST